MANNEGKKERLIAIGDIHGCFHTLASLLIKLKYTPATDTLVFIGDYIDKGLYSFDTVDFLLSLLEQAGADRVVCLKGNHEYLATAGDRELWTLNGGLYTLLSYEMNGKDISEHAAWMRGLPLVYETPEMVFCHAGLAKEGRAPSAEEDLLWARDWMEQSALTPKNKQVVFGHTPGREVYRTANNSLCIDTGCVQGNKLTALVVIVGEMEFVQAQKHENDSVEL